MDALRHSLAGGALAFGKIPKSAASESRAGERKPERAEAPQESFVKATPPSTRETP
jgi:hypothetical protein